LTDEETADPDIKIDENSSDEEEEEDIEISESEDSENEGKKIKGKVYGKSIVSIF
jgi:hypothetical protein